MFYSHARFWLYLLTWIPFALCTGFYGIRSPWQQSRVGQGLFSLYASITAVLTLAVIAQLTAIPTVATDVLRGLFLGAVLLAGFVQLAIIIKLQREAKRSCTTPRRRKNDF